MKHIHLLLSLLTCIITVTTTNAMLVPRVMALFNRSLSRNCTQSTLRFSTNETAHMMMLNFMDPKNIAQSTESDIQLNAGEACSSKMVPQWLSYALYFAKDNPDVEHKYAQLIDRTLQYAAADKCDYANTRLWNQDSILPWQPYYGTYPLHEAVYYNLSNITNVLLQHKAAFSLRDSWGRTALHWARKPEMVHTLVKNGAPINAQDEDGDSPLHFAKSEIIPILLEYGADVSLKNEKKEILCAYAYYERNRGWIQAEDLADQARMRIAEQNALIESYMNNSAISVKDKKEFSNDLIDEDRGCHYLAWRLHGVTPPMRAVLYEDPERFESFLACASPTALAKQLNPLQLAASCVAVRSDEGKELVRMINEYQQKHDI